MSDYPDLDEVLKKEVKDWTNTDRNIIASYNLKIGRGQVKKIRDDLNGLSEQN